MDRRNFLRTGSSAVAGTAVAAGGLLQAQFVGPAHAQAAGPAYSGAPALVPQKFYPQQQQFRIGNTTNSRGGWEWDPFLAMTEAREVGFRYVEIFGRVISAPEGNSRSTLSTFRPAPKNKVWPSGYVYTPPSGPMPPREVYYPDRWEALQHRVYEIGVQFTCINGGAAGAPDDFANVALRKDVVDNHFNMARFSSRFGCDHQKTNTGARRKGPDGRGVAQTSLEDLKNVAITAGEIGKRCKEELGIKFGVHAHLGAQLATEFEINYIMENTNPEHVYFVLDTSMVNMAGVDPLKLIKKLGNRICEFHLKDNAKDTRGGAKKPMVDMPDDSFNDPISYPLGEGGIDFPAIIEQLRAIKWRGHLVVELETSPWHPPQESARISANYIRNKLKLEL